MRHSQPLLKMVTEALVATEAMLALPAMVEMAVGDLVMRSIPVAATAATVVMRVAQRV